MTAASSTAPGRSCCRGFPRAEPRSRKVRPVSLEKEMGMCIQGTRRGMGPSAFTRVAEIMSGRAITQQGLTATCKDLAHEECTEGRGGFWSDAWARTSDEGGITPSEMAPEVIPIGGNTPGGQRSPGHSAVEDYERREHMAGHLIRSKLSRRDEYRRHARWVRGEEAGKPIRRGVYASQRLSFRRRGKASSLTNVVQGRGQNRTREIRPSGIAGGLQEMWLMVELGTHHATERAWLETLPLPARAPDFYPDERGPQGVIEA